MHSDPNPQSALKTPIEWLGYGLLSSSRTLSPIVLSLPVWSVIGTMSCEPWPTYEDSAYGRLEESLFEYMDDDMLDKLVPAIKKGLCDELTRRRESVSKLEAVIAQLFPNENC
jgi:hypothetical protein